MAAEDPSKKGLTTIGWGPDGWLTDTALDTEVIVESIQVTSKNEIIEIGNNDGVTISEILIKNGFDAVIKALYDSAVTWPVDGDVVKLDLPHVVGPDSGSFECLLKDITPEAKRKGETMLTLAVQYRPGVNLTP